MSLLFNFKAYFTGSNYKLKTCLLLNVVYFLQIFVSTGREQEKTGKNTLFAQNIPRWKT